MSFMAYTSGANLSVSYFCEKNLEIGQCYALRHSLNFWILILILEDIMDDSFKCFVAEKRAFLSTSTQILESVSAPGHTI